MSKNHLVEKMDKRTEKRRVFECISDLCKIDFHIFFSEDEEIVITSTSLNTEKLKREMIPWERQKEAELEGKKV